jgi:hypothetical protein
VEGLAVHGDTLCIGLRGPVLRGWACVLEVLPAADYRDPTRLRLGAALGPLPAVASATASSMLSWSMCPWSCRWGCPWTL